MRSVCLLFSVLCGPSIVNAAGYGFDVGVAPAEHAVNLAASGITGGQGTWMRVRGVVDPTLVPPDGQTRTVDGDRAGLQGLRDLGIKTTVFLRWSPNDWTSGGRPGGGQRMPLDLREAYERGRMLGETYGDLVDVWEIDNEPDIGFVADNIETYAAFLKAVYLGLSDGAERREARGRRTDYGEQITEDGERIQTGVLGGLTWLGNKRGWRSSDLRPPSSVLRIPAPRVVMAPLALPPGPFLERLWANGLPSYTDGFNYHYYGYAEDFSGVYQQFRDAIAKLQAESLKLRAESSEVGDNGAGLKADRSKLIARKSWPIFITEYGYGLLDAEARNTMSGRVDQWRWFSSVIKQVHDLRIEAPMAFYWNPYYEAGINEFGLTMAAQPELRSSLSHKIKLKTDAVDGDRGVKPLLQFEAADFGEVSAQPWMRLIGKKVGDAYASPALAYLWDYAVKHPYRPLGWKVAAEPASPVVIDFVAGADWVQMKSSGGYQLKAETLGEGREARGARTEDGGRTGFNAEDAKSTEGGGVRSAPLSAGSGTVVVYNYSNSPIAGRLLIHGNGITASLTTEELTLPAGARRELPVDVRVSAERYAGHTLRVQFVPDDKQAGRAVFATRLFPSTQGMLVQDRVRFDFSEEETQRSRTILQTRPLAGQEPALKPYGRWLVSDGVRVEEIGSLWRFSIDHLPAEPLHSARVELPLPDGFSLPDDSLVLLERRLVEMRQEARGERPEVAGDRLKSRSGVIGNMMTVYIRTENGNLFQSWPRLSVTQNWAPYAAHAADYTMSFFGRAALPWRFAENRPVSLVFFMSPSQLPAIFEVMDARVVRIAAEGR